MAELILIITIQFAQPGPHYSQSQFRETYFHVVVATLLVHLYFLVLLFLFLLEIHF